VITGKDMLVALLETCEDLEHVLSSLLVNVAGDHVSVNVDGSVLRARVLFAREIIAEASRFIEGNPAPPTSQCPVCGQCELERHCPQCGLIDDLG
jgi:hypothetical protein